MVLQAEKPVFELKHAEFSYPLEEPVLKNLSFQIGAGERVCILGANGCGKSTLLKIFAGLISPQKGSFLAFGKPVTEKERDNDTFARQYHRRIGFLFQDSDVQLFCSTVQEEIAFGLLQLGFDAETVSRRMSDVCSLLGIGGLLGKAPFHLSGGEKKKVALASVLAMNPDVYILDEPTNGLDPRTQTALMRLFETLSAAGKTLVTSTHHLELARRISDRSLLLTEQHELAADGPTENLLRRVDLLQDTNLVDKSYSV